MLRREYDLDKKRLQTQIAVDNVRSLRTFLGLSAADGGWRVVIVDAADEMNPSSANGLLKFLEEPPARTVFLLISHAPGGLLPTVRSRCRTLDLVPLGADDLDTALAGIGAQPDPGDLAALRELGGGSVGRAAALIGGDGVALYRAIASVLGSGHSVDRAAATALAESCAGRGAAHRYALVVDLTQTLLGRLARAAASGSAPQAASENEPELFAALASRPEQAAPWAEALAQLSGSTRHAMAVNLDPAQCVLDMMLAIDATLGRVRAVAA